MYRLIVLIIVASALLAACGAPAASGAGIPPAPTTPPIVSHGSSVTDDASLLDELRRVGASVEPAGDVEQPFFPVKGQVIKVDGGEVQVFEFASVEEAEAQAARVALDGSSIGTSMVTWMGTPNFFKAGRIIALYVGGDALTLDHLAQALGLPFAGGPFAGQAPALDNGATLGSGMLLPAASTAVQALAAARNIGPDQIAVISAERVEWPNACLGAAQPGQACAEVITPGYWEMRGTSSDAY